MSSIYSPLRDDKAEIRLLKLEPASCIDDVVVCSLHVSSLDDQPDFEALSYCWGDPTVTKMCLLNGVEWPLTVNLESGLRHLRHPNESIIMWVDAVCINQQDVQERNSQVALMRTIYSSASTVRVWLGESADGSDEVMQTIHELATIDPSINDISACYYDFWCEGQCVVNDNLTITRPGISFFHTFARRPWWSRTWVLQEVMLASSTIVHCGYQKTSIEDFFKIRDVVFNLFDMDIQRSLRVKRLVDHLNDAILTFQELQRLLHPHQSSIMSLCSLTLKILMIGQNQEVIDPRDRIYGMLGIVPDVMSHIRPDYDFSIEQIYTSYALQLVETSKSLSVFEFAVGPRNLQLQLPSWVPDWSMPNREQAVTLRNQHTMNDRWQACGNLDLSIHSDSSTTIRVRGMIIGNIVRTAHTCETVTNEDGEPIDGVLTRELETYLQLLAMCGLNFPKDFEPDAVAYNTVFQTISRCLTIDEQSGLPIRLTTEAMMFDDTVFSRLWHWLCNATGQSYPLADTNVAKLYGLINMQNRYMRFVKTMEGDVGTAPSAVLPGDVIYVLGGGKQAYVLRPVHGTPQKPTFTLVGPCYLQGYMMGEATIAEGWTSKCHDVYIQ